MESKDLTGEEKGAETKEDASSEKNGNDDSVEKIPLEEGIKGEDNETEKRTEIDAHVKKRPLEEECEEQDGQPEKRSKTEDRSEMEKEDLEHPSSDPDVSTNKEVDDKLTSDLNNDEESSETTETVKDASDEVKDDSDKVKDDKKIEKSQNEDVNNEDGGKEPEKMDVDDIDESKTEDKEATIVNEAKLDKVKSEEPMDLDDNKVNQLGEEGKSLESPDKNLEEISENKKESDSDTKEGESEDATEKSESKITKASNKSEDKQSEVEGTEDKSTKSDEGSVHSEDSEKENVRVEMPMDLSTKTSKPSTPSQDIIMLSDESDVDDLGVRRKRKKNIEMDIKMDEVKLRQKMIKRLQAELRNEEAKLVLLKKLRVSQMSHQLQNNIPGKSQANQHQSQPPPLVRGGNQAQQQKQAQSQPPQLSRPGSQPTPNGNKSQGPPPLVMAPRVDQRQLIQNQMKMLQQQQQQQQQQQISSNRSSNAALASYRSSQSQSETLRQIQQAQNRVPEETPAQRQAAAKLALRKQLEKTLLQIPPPKPPPPEMNFIPNLASPDFVYLLGLEEAVNHIIDTNLISKGRKNPDEKMVCNPFTCVQCNTDFTPVWKREKPGSKNVICEQCVTTNQKKALKQEHTNRLKSAFVKALQQEQEIERMQSQESKSNSASASSTPKESKPESQRERESSRESPVTTSRNSSQAYKESMAETIRQHHNLLQAHQAAALRMGQPLGMQGFNPRAPFPYQLPFAARASDLQRQYLLDMIPKGGLPWSS